MKKEPMLTVLCLAIVLFAVPLWAADTPETNAPKEGKSAQDVNEINKQLTLWKELKFARLHAKGVNNTYSLEVL
jgi:hypothetical protein